MNSIRKWIRDNFGFSGNEINGFLILIPLMVILIFSEPIYSTVIAHREEDFEQDKVKLDSLISFWARPLRDSLKTNSHPKQVPLFAFDPNSAPVETLRTLGFSETSANRIAAYRQKGGTFRIKSDLMKIYGLDSTLYQQLYSYILLPSQRKEAKFDTSRRGSVSQVKVYEAKGGGRAFDINQADTVVLKSVYGIGSTLASRIIKFRDGLGGFIKSEQLKEVYGLDSMVVSRLLKVTFIQEGFTPVKININTANEQQLSAHPYIRYRIARVLITYRFQHGDFMEVNDIKKISMLKPEEIERFLPYMKVNE